MRTMVTSQGLPYEIVSGFENAEEITDFRQTSSCFSSHEVDPVVGCDFGCRYCSMYAQQEVEKHLPIRVYKDYPAYLESHIRSQSEPAKLVFNFSPKTDVLALSLIESGVTERILRVFKETGVQYYILTKGRLPPAEIQELLIGAKDRNQVII